MSYTAGERHWALYETTRNEQMHDWEYRLVRDEHGVGLAIPDHPALPALAKLLHEYPGLADAVKSAAESHRMSLNYSEIAMLTRLAAALAETEGDDDENEPAPAFDPVASILKVAGKSFRCLCGANVFINHGPNKYRCNACGNEYEATKARP